MTRRSSGEESTGRRGARNVGLDKGSGFSESCMSLSRHRQASEDCVLALQRDGKTLEEPVGLWSGSVARPGRQQAPESVPGATPPSPTGFSHKREELESFSTEVLLSVEVGGLPGLVGSEDQHACVPLIE